MMTRITQIVSATGLPTTEKKKGVRDLSLITGD
jgi:hypothetical protein